MEYDYIVRLIGDEILIIKLSGSWADAYETARNYHVYASNVTIEDGHGKVIITLTREQLMDDRLKIEYEQ